MIRARNLSVLLALALAMTAIATGVRAQDKDAKPADKPGEAVAAAPPKEESSVTDHSIKIGGQVISYKATAATILLKNEKDEPTALVYYTAYTRSGEKDLSQRPIAFVYNKRLVKPEEVPKTHPELAKQLEEHPDRWKGKLTAYDPERSGIGWSRAGKAVDLLAALDVPD